MRGSGSSSPITPVERTSTSGGLKPSRHAAPAAVVRASRSPRGPVAAFAIPELITTACGCASSRCSFEIFTGAAAMRLTVNMAAPVPRRTERTIARSGFSRRIPQWTPLAAKPLGAVTPVTP